MQFLLGIELNDDRFDRLAATHSHTIGRGAEFDVLDLR